MSLYHGLFVRSASNASLAVVLSNIASPDSMAVYTSEGLLQAPAATLTASSLTYVPNTQTATAPLVVATAVGFENVAILQISATGIISIKYGTPVALGSGLSQYPAADATDLVLAELFTPAVPLRSGTLVVTQANISNKVLNAEFGGR